MKKIFLLVLLLLPSFVFAQESIKTDKYYKAEVVEVIKQQTTILPDGGSTEQQDLKLKLLDGEKNNNEVVFNGINNFDVISKNIYNIGDQVLVLESINAEGQASYYITDYIRTKSLWWLIAVFVITITVVGKWKGVRSLISLVASFLVIIKFIIPQILSGANPLLITIIGSVAILLAVVYITEGINHHSHVAVVSIFLSLLLSVFLAWFFVQFGKLSGFSSEEDFSLINIGQNVINFKGLLLAGIIIGTLGVLDDVVISQITAVKQLYEANRGLSKKQIFKRAYEIGVSHISSMTNTLFLAYAGVSMSLLILFISGQSAFNSWAQIINNEAIATEIVRTLAGSIGLILSVPISTFLATWWEEKK